MDTTSTSRAPTARFGTSDDGYIAAGRGAVQSRHNDRGRDSLDSPALNRFERITIDGLANPLLGRGLINTSGVLLSGLSNGVPGSPFIATFGVGPRSLTPTAWARPSISA